MKIVVIIPTYNERQNIEKMLPILEEEVFPKVKSDEMFILVADDKSPDGTSNVVKQAQKKWKNIELLEGDKEGLGAAYIRAMQYAMEKMHADAVIEFDADFQHDPHDIPRLVEAADRGADYVIGSRYVKGGAIPKEWGIDRKIKSIFGSLFARIVWLNFKIHDMTSGFKLTKTSYLKKVDLDHLYSKNYAYKLQILYEVVKLGAKVKEVPIVFYERTVGKSKMDPNDLIESFTLVMRLRIRDSQSFLKFLVVGVTGLAINLTVYFYLANYTTMNLILANTVGAELAILSNFNLNNFWTFKHKKTKSFMAYLSKLAMFLLTSNIGVQILQNGTIGVGQHFFGRKYALVYFVLGTGVLLIYNFTVYSKFIWKDEK